MTVKYILRILNLSHLSQVMEVSLLLGLMAKYSCEECKLLLLHKDRYTLFEMEDQATILANLVQAIETSQVWGKL